MLSLVNPQFKILFSEVGGTAILLRKKSKQRGWLSMVWVGLEVAAASALHDEMFVIIFRFAWMITP